MTNENTLKTLYNKIASLENENSSLNEQLTRYASDFSKLLTERKQADKSPSYAYVEPLQYLLKSTTLNKGDDSDLYITRMIAIGELLARACVISDESLKLILEANKKDEGIDILTGPSII